MSIGSMALALLLAYKRIVSFEGRMVDLCMRVGWLEIVYESVLSCVVRRGFKKKTSMQCSRHCCFCPARARPGISVSSLQKNKLIEYYYFLRKSILYGRTSLMYMSKYITYLRSRHWASPLSKIETTHLFRRFFTSI
jgi:hypothetical protein